VSNDPPRKKAAMTNGTGALYGRLASALNALENREEMPLADDGFEIVGLSGAVIRDPSTGEWRVVEQA
jgi:hypothetical protein